jgi:hypothetical protein
MRRHTNGVPPGASDLVFSRSSAAGAAANGDFVATELVGTGTSTGPAIISGRDPIPPSGRHVEFGMAGFLPLDSGGWLVAEERYYYDRLTMIQQLNPPS